MSRLPATADALLTGLDRVCVAVAARTAQELHRAATAEIAAGSRFLELRLDALAAPGDGVAVVGQLVHTQGATVLATCRGVGAGGGFTGSVPEQFALLADCAAAGARLIDLDVEALEAADSSLILATAAQLASQGGASGPAVLLSAHDYQGTGDLDAALDRLRKAGALLRPALFKVVSTATSLADSLRMLAFLNKVCRHTPVVGMCMGPAGAASRVLAVRAGGLFTFAAAEGTSGTAPGQFTAQRMRGEFRVDALGPATKIYGVAGNPVSHSLSPAMHNAAFREAGVDAVYLPLHTPSVDDLRTLAEGLPLAGFSVTMPWKVTILPHLDRLDPLAERVGAVNTVVRQADGSFYGTNTDVAAIVEPLGERIPLAGARVLVAGAGGAARAAVFGLRAAGAAVTIVNRTRAAAEALARESGSRVADTGVPDPEVAGGYAVIVNATPAGMTGPLRDMLAVSPHALADARLVFETVYRPAETPLIRLARERGIAVIGGREMFLRQGMRQWELWTGQPAPRLCMQTVLEEAAAQAGEPAEPEGAGHEQV